LPLPLASQPIGQTPEVAGPNARPFFLAYESLAGSDLFHLAGVAESDLKALYAEPFFFQAVAVDDRPATIAKLQADERKRLEAEQARALAALTAQPQSAGKRAKNGLPAEKQWLVWAEDRDAAIQEAPPADPAERRRQIVALVLARAPRVLARYDLPGQPPFLVARRIGRGEAIFCSSGLLSSWNTLPKTNAILIFDRLLRGMIESTLPRRTLPPTERLALPLPAAEQNLLVHLARPGDSAPSEPLDVGYIGADRRGVTIAGLVERGVYRIVGFRPGSSASAGSSAAQPAWEIVLAINGSGDEADLTPLARKEFAEMAAAARLGWVGPGEPITLAGTAIRGQRSWWWLVLAALLLLLAEMAILAWPAHQGLPPLAFAS
jgi:hypothetical protein